MQVGFAPSFLDMESNAFEKSIFMYFFSELPMSLDLLNLRSISQKAILIFPKNFCQIHVSYNQETVL